MFIKIFVCSLFLLGTFVAKPALHAQTNFETYPVYTGDDLGIKVLPKSVSFKLWSPPASAVRLHLYKAGSGGKPLQTILLKKSSKGVWQTSLKKEKIGQYYTVQVQIGDKWLDETPDPYAKAVGVNGKRGMILDLNSTNPTDWNKDTKPVLTAPTDIILYELQIRDLSANPNSGIKNAGKYLAFSEKGTKSKAGLSTGIDHIKGLGVTHVHLLPSFDFRSIDESKPQGAPYNWGYDPENYNAPEGSFSSNPDDAAVRIREFKGMVQSLHANGLRVVMDVVYNHTGSTNESVFNRVVPGYYYRQRKDGSFSDASACGNETASERAMMRKYIIESVKYWTNEYHIDGFRFDLMGIHDIETMNQISAELHKINPSIFIYGEGWTAGDSPLPVEQRALKAHVLQLKGVAAFSDDFRDALKGSVFEHKDRGFVSGKPGMEESIKFGIVASTQHPQIDYSKVNYSKAPWSKDPAQTITYVECHDNHTLWDRLAISSPEANEADRIRMHLLATTMVLTSQGVPFIHAGMEMLRTKNGEENSYNLPDAINQFDWDRKQQYQSVHDYYQSLIQLRKRHPAFRMPNVEMIQKNLHFLPVTGTNKVAYQLTNNANGDAWKNIVVLFNGNTTAQTFEVPAGKWKIVIEGQQIKESGLGTSSGGSVRVAGISTLMLVEE